MKAVARGALRLRPLEAALQAVAMLLWLPINLLLLLLMLMLRRRRRRRLHREGLLIHGSVGLAMKGGVLIDWREDDPKAFGSC